MINNLLFLLAPSEKAIAEDGYTYLPPLCIGLLAGYLKKRGLDVELSDLGQVLPKIYSGNEEQFSFLFQYDNIRDYVSGCAEVELEQKVDTYVEQLLNGISIDQYDMVGISCGADFSFFQVHSALLIGNYIKKKYNTDILLGGNNITYLLMFEDTFSELLQLMLCHFPYVMKGPGEHIIWQLVQCLNGELDSDVYELNGMVYLKDDSVVANQEEQPRIVCPDWCNLDMSYYYLKVRRNGKTNTSKNEIDVNVHLYKWPFYLSHFVSNVHKHQKRQEFNDVLVLPYIFNFHCPYSCAFCSESDIERKNVILGDPEQTVNDLQWLSEQYNTNYFYFFNNAINASSTFMKKFCNLIIERNLDFHWSDCARFNGMTYERLKLLKKAGCKKLVFGFETASKKLIELVDKRIDLEHAEQVLKWCKELGIWADLEVIIGLPQEGDEEFAETVSYVQKNKELINFMTINEFFVVPRSKIGLNPEKYGIKLIKNIVNYEKILNKSLNYFLYHKGKPLGNFKIYKYFEIGGRSFKEILEQNVKKIRYMNSLQNKEFTEVESIYRMINKKQFIRRML